jgi:hypothetical protein
MLRKLSTWEIRMQDKITIKRHTKTFEKMEQFKYLETT